MYKLQIIISFLLILNTFCENVTLEEENDDPIIEISNDEYMEFADFSRSTINRQVVINSRIGKIIGITMESAVKGKRFYAFRGIPYALPPIRDLRFSPPVPYTNSKKRIIYAGRERDVCLQYIADTNTGGTTSTTEAIPEPGSSTPEPSFPTDPTLEPTDPTTSEPSTTTESISTTTEPSPSTTERNPYERLIGSEDCLYLNVYVPQTKKSHKLPVIVNIHGGAFLLGSGNADYYGPDYLLNNDVIYVSFNYRLGPLGFLATEDFVVPGNNGLKDQLLALQWVKNNIAAFGGNPHKITIMGQSAGGASVGYLLQSPLAKGLFKGAIMLSGNSLCPWSLQRNARENAFELGLKLGIFTNSTRNLVSHLRRKSAEDITLAHIQMADFYNDPGEGMIFVPVREPYHPYSIFSDRSYRVVSDENLNAADIMIGYTSLEGITMSYGFDPIAYGKEDFLVPEDMNIIDPRLKTALAAKVKEHYYGNGPINIDGAIHFITDEYFVRATVKYMQLASKKHKIYGYKFTYEGELGSPNRAIPGVGHSEDISYIFKQATEPFIISKRDILTRLRWCQLIGNFAWSGNPTPTSEHILDNLRWGPVSESRSLSYLEFGENLVMNVKPNQVDVEFWERLYSRANQPFDTY